MAENVGGFVEKAVASFHIHVQITRNSTTASGRLTRRPTARYLGYRSG
jgi:hypothetical protein